jgi:hypothetical protein
VSHPPARTDLACRNCGTQAPLNFCPECGQETAVHPPSLGEFLHEFVGHYIALEGALWRTLGMLLMKPGRLTREYLDGRRRRYVLPLRLYLTASFLFFLVLKLGMSFGVAEPARIVRIGGQSMSMAEYSARSASGAASGTAVPKLEAIRTGCGGVGQPVCGRVGTYMNGLLARLEDNPDQVMEHMQGEMLHVAPYMIFVLLPVFAGIMMLAYRSRKMTYGEHFVFSLHLHAFWFLALMVVQLVPNSIGSVVQLAVPVYGTWAMHEAYGGRWLPTILRALVASVAYAVVLLVAMSVLSFALLAAA